MLCVISPIDQPRKFNMEENQKSKVLAMSTSMTKSGSDVYFNAPPTSSNVIRTLAATELKKYFKKFKFNFSNCLKFLLMVFCCGTSLLISKADVISEFQDPFKIHLGIGSCVLPSIFRVSNMFCLIDISAPVLDLLIVVFILGNTSMACIILFLVIQEEVPDRSSATLEVGIGLTGLSIAVCLIELISFAFNTKLMRRSDRWTSLIHPNFGFEAYGH